MTDPLVVDTSLGRVRGSFRAGAVVFRGLPYAAGTGGARRFLPPQPATPWAGVREAREFGPRAPQNEAPRSRLFQWLTDDTAQGEDCLVLNVHTPAADASRRPVMVYLHGGAFAIGSGSSPVLDGSSLAVQENVVVVTLNHRLNALGYLYAGPEAEPRFADAGNAGMLDLVAALQWVRDNIAAFGGDPGCVTIFGQSGGGAKVAILMAMPAAQGLFHRAIVQSSSSGFRVQEPEDAARAAHDLFLQLGLAPHDFAALQAVPAAALLKAMQQVIVKQGGHDHFRPVIDGRSLTRHPFYPEAPDISARVPLLIGATRTEATFFLIADPSYLAIDADEARRRVQRMLKLDDARTDALLAVYRQHHPDATPSELLGWVASDHMYRVANIGGAEQKARQGGAPVYAYELAWESPALGGKLKSPHTADLPFVFGNLEVAEAFTGSSPELLSLSRRMMRAWALFARSGDPNVEGMPTWKPYTLPERHTMVFNSSCRLVADPRGAEREAMQALPPFLPGSPLYPR